MASSMVSQMPQYLHTSKARYEAIASSGTDPAASFLFWALVYHLAQHPSAKSCAMTVGAVGGSCCQRMPVECIGWSIAAAAPCRSLPKTFRARYLQILGFSDLSLFFCSSSWTAVLRYKLYCPAVNTEPKCHQDVDVCERRWRAGQH